MEKKARKSCIKVVGVDLILLQSVPKPSFFVFCFVFLIGVKEWGQTARLKKV